jgi:hypothetical protein
MFTDLPRLGTVQRFGISNPMSAQTNAWTMLLCAARPHRAFPCGQVTPNLGMLRGTPGEILIDLQGPWFAVPGEVFRGVGHVAYASLTIPNDTNLIGHELYCQGVLVDPGRATAAVTAGARCVFGY